MKIYNSEKNNIGFYKVYKRKVRNDAYGDYVLIGGRKYYIDKNGFVLFWHVRMTMDK